MNGSAARTDNLAAYSDGSFVFDADKSDIRTMVGHRVSVVLPTTPAQDTAEFRNVIVVGDVVYLEYAVGKENQTPQMKKGFSIHGQSYPLWAEAKTIHHKGLADAKRFASGPQVTVVGAEICECPRTLYLDRAHVQVSSSVFANRIDQLSIAQMTLKIQQMTGRSIQVVPLNENTVILVVPVAWILQDHTAINEVAKRDPAKATPIIKYPVAFPNLGTRLSWHSRNGLDYGTVQDFEIVYDSASGTRVEVKLEPGKYLGFSNVYARNLQELHNPAIIRIVTPQEYADKKVNYLTDAREMIRSQLMRWTSWKICDGNKGPNVMATSFSKNKGKDRNAKGEKTETVWLEPADVFGRNDLNIVSFDGGSIMVDGDEKRIVYRERIDAEDTDVIYLHDIDADTTIKDENLLSLRFNACRARGQALLANGKVVDYHWSTRDGKKMSMMDVPLFAPLEPTNRPIVDLKTLDVVLGYLGKSTEEKYKGQDVICWVETTMALRMFHLWVIKRGEADEFKGKEAADLRKMFDCEVYPYLVDIYNFMIGGVTDQNPTRNSTWTRFFVKFCLSIDPHDLSNGSNP